jgi:hypothetical protein
MLPVSPSNVVIVSGHGLGISGLGPLAASQTYMCGNRVKALCTVVCWCSGPLFPDSVSVGIQRERRLRKDGWPLYILSILSVHFFLCILSCYSVRLSANKHFISFHPPLFLKFTYIVYMCSQRCQNQE